MPNPLKGFFTTIGHGLRFVFGGSVRWIYHHFFVSLGHAFKFAFGSWWPVAAAVCAVSLGVGAGYLLYRRRSRVERVLDERRVMQIQRENPADLEERARVATAQGDYESAVRLWFLAGVLRLTTKGSVANGTVRTDRELMRSVPSTTFAELARRHEQIVYGRQRATLDDANRASEQWPKVLRDVALRSS